jgi:hypothetical protein
MKLNRVRRRRRDLQKAAGDEDRISNLPNDLLLNILERLDTLDAIRTCILSKRMQNLLTMLSRIVILLSPRDLFRMNGVVADVTNKMLRTRSPHITIFKLKVRFILRLDDCLSIGKSVALAMATQKLDAAEFEISNQRWYCTKSDLRYFARQFNNFVCHCPDAFAGLTRLHLQKMSFREPDMANILSTCKRLESLCLFRCDAGIHYVLRVEHAALVELDITFGGFTTVELNFVPKLQKLSYDTWTCEDNPLVLGFVPRLSKLSLTKASTSDRILVLSELLAGAPSVRDMHLDFRRLKIWVRPERPRLVAPVLGKLRTVNLENLRDGCDISWTMFILEAAPSLEELCVTVSSHRCLMERTLSEETDVKWEASARDLKHKNLAKLTIHGFQPDDNFTGYVRRIMKAAVNIKEVSLHDWKVCEMCSNKKVHPTNFRLSIYPRTSEEKDFVRRKISEGLRMASPAVIHFRPSCYVPFRIDE